MDEDSCNTVHKVIEQLIHLVQVEGRRKAFVMGMTAVGRGVCFHCNPYPGEEAIRALELHCSKRKYVHQATSWFGVSVGLKGEIQFGITLDFPWERSPEMDELTKDMRLS
jgi:hypothetical protein